MKTAARLCLAALFGAVIMPAAPAAAQVLGEAASSVGAMAQQQAQIQAQAAQVETQAQAQMQAQSAAPVLPAMPMPVAAPTQTATMPKVAAAPSGVTVLPDSAVTTPAALQEPEDEDTASIKVPKSVNDVLKKLDKATDNVTLEDINAARDAIAKLDVLLDIEKRLTDLASIRHDREEKSVAAALPASALGMAPTPSAAIPNYPAPGGAGAMMAAPPPVMAFSSDPEVLRIVGADGRFVASIKEVDGKTLRVREGDKLMDGSVVESISRNGLTIERDKNKRTIRVKDVGTVFGGR